MSIWTQKLEIPTLFLLTTPEMNESPKKKIGNDKCVRTKYLTEQIVLYKTVKILVNKFSKQELYPQRNILHVILPFLPTQNILRDKIARPHRKLFGLFYLVERWFSDEYFPP